MIEQFWYAFIPLFVAFDGIGLLPMFWALASRLDPGQRRREASVGVLTALVVAVVFLLVSKYVFTLMGLRFSDVMVAGGVILIALCLKELLAPDKMPEGVDASPGVVPLGVPLLAGPAVLTTMLLVRDQYGWWITLIALFANMALVWVMLRASEWLMRRLGREGAQVISKIANLILTAFGVMLVRQGLALLLTPSGKT